jgi:predicted tellurium resistance membrane protein TerC
MFARVIPLLTLTAMEIVLGIDNIIFIALVAGRLPGGQQATARRLGLGLALVSRLLLLCAISWVLGLTRPLFALSDLGLPAGWLPPGGDEISGRDLILIGGGLFLIAKSVYEIHDKLEGASQRRPDGGGEGRLGRALVQIMVLDIVFSLDSVITAVGMAQQLWVMMVAVVLAVGVMLAFAGPVSAFVHRHPTIQMLALSFLLLIGVMLVAEGIEKHIERGYIYFAMAFSLVVELLNQRLRSGAAPAARDFTEASSP